MLSLKLRYILAVICFLSILLFGGVHSLNNSRAIIYESSIFLVCSNFSSFYIFRHYGVNIWRITHSSVTNTRMRHFIKVLSMIQKKINIWFFHSVVFNREWVFYGCIISMCILTFVCLNIIYLFTSSLL